MNMIVAVIVLSFVSIYTVTCDGLATSPSPYRSSISADTLKSARTGRTHYGYTNYAMPPGYQYGVYPHVKEYATFPDPGWYGTHYTSSSTQEPSRSDQHHSDEQTPTASPSDVSDARERPIDASNGGFTSSASQNVESEKHAAASSKIVNLMDDVGDSSSPSAIEIVKPTFPQQVKNFLKRQLSNVSFLIVPAILLLITLLQYLSKFFFGAVQVYEVMTGIAVQRASRNLNEDNFARILESIASFERENGQRLSCVQHLLTCDTAAAGLLEEDSQYGASAHKQIRSLIKRVTGNKGMVGRFVRPLFEGDCVNTRCPKSNLQDTIKLFKNASDRISSWMDEL